jgi:hypothetical protein
MTPQETWTDIINESMKDCPPTIASFIRNLSSCENVPRKEKAFRNFAANSLKLRGPNGDAVITSIWKHLNFTRDKKLNSQNLSSQETSEKVVEKRKQDETNEKQNTSNSSPNTGVGEPGSTSKVGVSSDTRKVVKAMKKALTKAPSQQMRMKDMRKLIKKKLESDSQKVKKEDLKEVIAQAIAQEKSFSSEGKLVKLTQ